MRSQLDVRVGERIPQLNLFPDYGSSAGTEAIELAATAGLMLDDWQQDILRHGLGERPDGQWAAREVGMVVPRQNGKGSVFEARELAGIVLFGERLIVHTAHEVKTAMEAFRRIQELFTNSDDLRRRVKRISNQNGEEGIELLGGQRLRFLARSKGSGRGFTADCLIWDEAYALTDDQVEAQMPVLSAVPNWQIWYGSSPPLNSVEGAVLMRLRRRALERSGKALAYFGWGRQDLDLTQLSQLDLDDIDLAYDSNPAMGIRITEETVLAQREAMGDVGYARERLCIFPPDLSANFQVIDEGAWLARQDPNSRIEGLYCMSVAVSVDRTRGAIAVAGWRPDGQAHVEITGNALEIDARPGTGWIVQRMAAIVARQKPRVVAVDVGAPQGSLIGDIEKAGIKIEKLITGDVARGWGMFYDGICGEDEVNRDVWHLGQPELTASVAGAITRAMGSAGTTWDARNSLVDITPLRAATDALYALKIWGHKGPPVLEGSLMVGGD